MRLAGLSFGWRQSRLLTQQRGASLIVCLLMLLAVLMLGTSAAQIAVQEEKAARMDGDREIALQAAEAALKDAELDIELSPRSHLMKKPEAFIDGCGQGLGNPNLGLCAPAIVGMPPVWLKIETGIAGEAASVPYGHVTQRSLGNGQGATFNEPPRYLIELVLTPASGKPGSEAAKAFLYRITAIGFGRKDSTQVVLQSLYRKAVSPQQDSEPPGRRTGWREILNWQELRNANDQ
ncbi:pilus assembly protein [Herbaspirillum sp. HC18]|nr:pilus assembly protein [Herbaspirillum sp. HC18]